MKLKLTTFSIDDNSIDNLKKLGFYHMGEGVYSKKFPVYFYNQTPTLFGIFIANNEDTNINIDVIDESGNLYFNQYSEIKNNYLLKIINKNIEKEMIRCNITKKVSINIISPKERIKK